MIKLNCAAPTPSAKWIQNIRKSMGIKVTKGRYKGMWYYFTGRTCALKASSELGGFSWPGLRGGQQKQKFKNEIEQGSRVDMEKWPKGGGVFSQSSIPLTCKGPVVSRTWLPVPVNSSGNLHRNRNIKWKRINLAFPEIIKMIHFDIILKVLSPCKYSEIMAGENGTWFHEQDGL